LHVIVFMVPRFQESAVHRCGGGSRPVPNPSGEAQPLMGSTYERAPFEASPILLTDFSDPAHPRGSLSGT